MANNVYSTVCNGCEFAINHACLKRKRHLKLFHAGRLLEFIAMDILGPLQVSTTRNPFIIVYTYQYRNLSGAISISKTVVPYIASIFFNHCMLPYVILAFPLAHTALQFLSKLFEMIYVFLKVKHLMDTAYHLQTSGQA